MDAYLLILCRRIHFKLCLELSIKSRQSLAFYCPTPGRRRTCSGSLQYTLSAVCLKNDENSASWILQYVTSVPDSNKFFYFKRDASTSEDSLDNFKSLTRSLNSAWLKRCGSVHDESNSLSLISYSSGTFVLMRLSMSPRDIEILGWCLAGPFLHHGEKVPLWPWLAALLVTVSW